MFESESKIADVAEIELVEAPAGAVDMRVTAKKGTGFYVRAATAFFNGVEAKPAADGKDAVEAKAPVQHIRISGLGEGAGVAASTALAVETAKVGTITRIQTEYASIGAGGR